VAEIASSAFGILAMTQALICLEKANRPA